MSKNFDLFGEDVLTDEILEKKMSKKGFKQYKEAVKNNEDLDKDVLEEIAKAMKEWAIKKGATHYSHWFQPLNGIVAEKQVSFLSADLANKPIIEFPVEALLSGETDASSFPNGGLRSVFEARGFTKWDYTYPAFLKEDTNGKVLCIPTIFFSPAGESLDKRTPLLKSSEALNNQLMRILKLFGDTKANKTFSTVGIEQEFFLIKKEHYKKRKDLMLVGRTILGEPIKDSIQKHYMSTISDKTGNFLKCVEKSLWKLGVPTKVKHNEVSKRQYEIVPQYETLSYGANHDFLTMEILQKEARKHDLICLLHEKPFKGMNGSGKHNNWSIYTDTGVNLFSYGNNATDNARFILMITAILSAVDKYASLIRATVATAGNDNRLSGNEAPTPIISIYLGEELTEAIDEIANDDKNKIKLGITEFLVKNKIKTDRNRTSPFAFIGNRFEFRMPGSNASITECNTVLNTIMAESLSCIADKLENSNDFYLDLKKLVKDLLNKHKRIIYNGNSYSKEWKEEAKARNLKNLETTVDAVGAFVEPETIGLFERYNVYTKKELEARYKINLETYTKTILLEAEVMEDMITKEILPNSLKYSSFLANNIVNEKNIGNINTETEEKILKGINEKIKSIYESLDTLKQVVLQTKNIENIKKKAKVCKEHIKDKMEKTRELVDNLESNVPKEYWPIPTYEDILIS